MNPDEVSYGKTVEAFERVTSFLKKTGVRPDNARLLAYREFLRDIKNLEPAKTDTLNATRLWREVHEIIFVIEIFIHNNITPPAELVVRSFNGKPLEEYSQTEGRNFFLELRASIYFIAAGYSVMLDQQCDIVATKGKDRIFVECKRLYSEGKARDRVNECHAQLDKRLAEADGTYRNHGLAWIDPSPAMQKHYFVYTAYSELGGRLAARTDLKVFWSDHVNTVPLHDKRILAVVLQMVWPGWIAGVGIRTGFTSLIIPGTHNHGFFATRRVQRIMNGLMSFGELH